MNSAAKRLLEIESRLEDLLTERRELEAKLQRLTDQKWSEEGLTERLRKTILSRFGSVHNIKVAKLMLNGHYNDEYNSYRNPVLLLIDKDFNDIKHDINPYEFCPSEEEQSEHYDQTGTDICDSVSIRFDK